MTDGRFSGQWRGSPPVERPLAPDLIPTPRHGLAPARTSGLAAGAGGERQPNSPGQQALAGCPPR